MRPVSVLATGGTIAMRGAQAVPSAGVRALVAEAVGADRLPELELCDLMNVPGAHLAPADALQVARAARDRARQGRGVVVTCGTDTMEELVVLADLLHDGDPPVVFTGANRPGSRPGADGPANLGDAVALAAADAASGLGAVIVFGGEVHAARSVLKVDATGPAAFGSPQTGPLGRVIGGEVWLAALPRRPATLDPARLDARVEIVTAHLGSDGRLLDGAAAVCDGLVVALLGAGHAPPAFLESLRRAAALVPVVATTRVARGGILRDTYGFPGAEREVRASGAIVAGLLSPAAARMKLLAGLGAALAGDALRAVFAGDDAIAP